MKHSLIAITALVAFSFTLACKGKFKVGTTGEDDPPPAAVASNPGLTPARA